MKRYAAAGLLLWVRPARDIDRLLQQRGTLKLQDWTLTDECVGS